MVFGRLALAAGAVLAVAVGAWVVAYRAGGWVADGGADGREIRGGGAVAGGGEGTGAKGGDADSTGGAKAGSTDSGGGGRLQPPNGSGTPLTDAEKEARERERNRWVEELKVRGSRWAEREAGRLSLTEDQKQAFLDVARETAEGLNVIRLGTGERDVERLVATLYESGDSRLAAVLTAQQAEKAMGLPRDWARDLIGESR